MDGSWHNPLEEEPSVGLLAGEGVRMAEKLNLLDTFPSITLSLVGGGTMSLPEDLTTPYAIVLFYRGHW